MPRSTSDQTESEPYRLATSASHLLHRAEQLASERFAQLVGEAVTLRQFAVLAAIAEASGLSQSELGRATGIDRSTLAEMVARMEKRGFITRTASTSDARAYSVRLTGAGATILSGATHHARAADAAILDLLPRTKRRTFLAILERIAKLSDEAAERAEREARRQAKREKKAGKKAATRARKRS